MDQDKAWIETRSGLKFYLLNPKPEQVAIEDIAHSLSMQCRFTGHTKFHYSVAQHSLYVSYLVPEQDALWGLLHDASEAYMGDVNRPLKYFTPVGSAYLKQETIVMAAVAHRFGLPEQMPESVHKADNMMGWAEKEQLISTTSWEGKWGTGHEVAPIKIDEISPRQAKEAFLTRFYALNWIGAAAA